MADQDVQNGLPNGWVACSIGQVTLPVSKIDPRKNPNREIDYIDISSIDNARQIVGDVKRYRIEEAPSRARQIVLSGDVLFATVRPYLRNIASVPKHHDRQIASTGFSILRPATGISPAFLYYKATSQDFVNALSRMQYGVSYPAVKDEQVRDQPLWLPPSAEQRRIASKIEELFSELDKGVESLKTARAQLKVYRQAVLKHAFEGKLTAQWREENKDKLETAEQLINRVPVPVQPRGGRAPSIEVIEGVAALAVNVPSKEPPSGWSWVPLLRIARQETGHTPSRKHSDYWNGDQYWLGIPDARQHNGKEIQDTIQKVTIKGLENSSARTLPAETVCFSRTASVGYVCLMTKPMATSQDFATWTCTQALKPKFLMYALMAEGDEIRRFGKGTTHTTIYFPEIKGDDNLSAPIGGTECHHWHRGN